MTETREDESSEEEKGQYPNLVRGGKKRLKVRSFIELKSYLDIFFLDVSSFLKTFFGILVDMIPLKIITQERQGSRGEPPSPSSSSELDISARGRPPRPWKKKQLKRTTLDDCAEHSSGTSGTKSNPELDVESSLAPDGVQQEVPFKALL